MHDRIARAAGTVRTSAKVLAAVTAPLLLAGLCTLSGSGTAGAAVPQPLTVTVAPTQAPADTSWGGCGGSCSQQP